MTIKDEEPRRLVTVVSAHEGADTWVSMIRHIRESAEYDIDSYHEFTDAEYRSARSRWQRTKLRLRTFVLYPARFVVAFRRISRCSDILVVVTSPFFMPLIAALAGSFRRARTVVLMNDIYPEALVAKGLLKRGGVAERLAKGVFAWSLKRLGSVVFISDSHRDAIAKDEPLIRKSAVIPVSAHSDPFSGHTLREVSGTVDILYCGTLGLMHDTKTFLDWLGTRRNEALRFAFHTSGASKARFESAVRARLRSHPATPVTLGDAFAEDEWARAMKAAQVGLVFQAADAGPVIFPSKVASILAAGQAVLAVADRDSDIARLVVKHDCGWVVQPNDVDGLDGCLLEISRGDVLLRKRINAFNLGHAVFGKTAVARRWIEVFEIVLGDRCNVYSAPLRG